MTKKTLLLTTTLLIVNLALAQHKDHPENKEKTNAIPTTIAALLVDKLVMNFFILYAFDVLGYHFCT